VTRPLLKTGRQKAPDYCLSVLLSNAGKRSGKALRSEEGNVMENDFLSMQEKQKLGGHLQ
jgi:hypothetical protein